MAWAEVQLPDGTWVEEEIPDEPKRPDGKKQYEGSFQKGVDTYAEGLAQYHPASLATSALNKMGILPDDIAALPGDLMSSAVRGASRLPSGVRELYNDFQDPEKAKELRAAREFGDEQHAQNTALNPTMSSVAAFGGELAPALATGMLAPQIAAPMYASRAAKAATGIQQLLLRLGVGSAAGAAEGAIAPISQEEQEAGGRSKNVATGAIAGPLFSEAVTGTRGLYKGIKNLNARVQPPEALRGMIDKELGANTLVDSAGLVEKLKQMIGTKVDVDTRYFDNAFKGVSDRLSQGGTSPMVRLTSPGLASTATGGNVANLVGSNRQTQNIVDQLRAQGEANATPEGALEAALALGKLSKADVGIAEASQIPLLRSASTDILNQLPDQVADKAAALEAIDLSKRMMTELDPMTVAGKGVVGDLTNATNFENELVKNFGKDVSGENIRELAKRVPMAAADIKKYVGLGLLDADFAAKALNPQNTLATTLFKPGSQAHDYLYSGTSPRGNTGLWEALNKENQPPGWGKRLTQSLQRIGFDPAEKLRSGVNPYGRKLAEQTYQQKLANALRLSQTVGILAPSLPEEY